MKRLVIMTVFWASFLAEICIRAAEGRCDSFEKIHITLLKTRLLKKKSFDHIKIELQKNLNGRAEMIFESLADISHCFKELDNLLVSLLKSRTIVDMSSYSELNPTPFLNSTGVISLGDLRAFSPSCPLTDVDHKQQELISSLSRLYDAASIFRELNRRLDRKEQYNRGEVKRFVKKIGGIANILGGFSLKP